jgi:hypothetical protein
VGLQVHHLPGPSPDLDRPKAYFFGAHQPAHGEVSAPLCIGLVCKFFFLFASNGVEFEREVILNSTKGCDTLVRFGGKKLHSNTSLSDESMMAVEGILDASTMLASSSSNELKSCWTPPSSLFSFPAPVSSCILFLPEILSSDHGISPAPAFSCS